MRRLSIIDLPGGHQPVFNEAGNVGIVFNGEIYNFRQLRKTLEERGHAFRTHSDTEVIVHAYEEWGEQCVRELRGMFAFAIWDARASGTSGEAARRARIFLARDRLGIKPLYYAFADGALLFASEVRALIASGRVAAAPGAGFAGSLSPVRLGRRTIHHGRRCVLDSSRPLLTFSADAPPAKPRRSPTGIFPTPRSKQRAEAEKFAGCGKTIAPVARRNGSRSPDFRCSAGRLSFERARFHRLVALASRSQSDLRTFTVVFPEQRFSEAKISRETAKHFKTRHQEVLLTPDILVAQLDDAVNALDQPTMDGLNTYFVSRAAHQAGLKVALSGLGSDEIFGGYSTFESRPRAAFVAGLGRWIPGPFRRMTAAAAMKIASGDAVRKARRSGVRPRIFPMPTISRGFCSLLPVYGDCYRLISSQGGRCESESPLAAVYAGDIAAGGAARFLHLRFLF